MRFLPVFLDLQSGPVLLVGAGDLVRGEIAPAGLARARGCAGSRPTAIMIWPASTLTAAARIELASGDPLTADLSDAIAILCAGAGDDRRCHVGTREGGGPARQCDGRSRAFHFHLSVRSSIAATSSWPSAPAARRRWLRGACASASRRCCRRASAISPASSARLRKAMRARIPEFSLRRRVLGTRDRRSDRCAGACRAQRPRPKPRCSAIADPSAFAGALETARPRAGCALVGAGPGDPDLLTIKALRALQDADVVFYDELVSPEILDRMRRDASRIPVGRRVGKPGIGQDAINKLLIDAAQAGTARRAAEGRRSLYLRPRRRGDRSAARGRRRLFGGAGHYRRPRCRRANSRRR